MSNPVHRWHWQCGNCGKTAASGMTHCPRCNALLTIHGIPISDDPDPVLPRKPVFTDDPTEQPTPVERVKKEPKQKKEGGKKWPLLLLLLLLLLAMLAAALFFFTGEADAPPPTEPSGPQRPPVATSPTDDTQPTVPTTVPPTTVPPTVPPTTVPPTTVPPTVPPTTEPPTVPPTTVPPTTDDTLEPNTLRCTIEGRETVFYVSRATVSTLDIKVTFYAYNPRGEQLYYLSLDFDKNLFEGSYQTKSSILYTDVKVYFKKIGSDDVYDTYPGIDARNYQPGTLVIEKISDDWMTYDGSFVMTLYSDNNKSFVIDDAVFNFTIQP